MLRYLPAEMVSRVSVPRPIYYKGREERPDTGLAEIGLLPPGEIVNATLVDSLHRP